MTGQTEGENIPNNGVDFSALPLQQWPDQWHPTERFPSPMSLADNPLKQHLQAQSFHEVQGGYRIGEPHLPVAPYRQHILETVKNSQSTVLSSETGSGKSSQTGLYLLEEGYPRIFVTQPRILAARDLHARAKHNLGSQYEHLAGYLTGNAKDSSYSDESKLVYVTEELLFKMANRGRLRPDDVIIPDEAHERTQPMVFLLGLMKELLQDSPKMRLMVSSATIDTDKFAAHLKDPSTGQLAPVLGLPGRTFPIKDIVTDEPVAKVARQFMDQGNNVLIFEPGIKRQNDTANKIQSRRSGHTVHLLYGDQTPREQRDSLNPDERNHIVSSRVGETSITPVNKNVVVDSGLSNVGKYEAGKSVLVTMSSSQATMTQRRGRVGRTQEGTYVIAAPHDAPPQPNFEDRDKYDLPPIEISSVSSYVAELLSSGRSIEGLDLIEQPTQENLQHDYKVLRRLGAIAVDEQGTYLTEVGYQMIDLPLDVPMARMLVEARTIDSQFEVDTAAVRLQVAAIAALRQVKGILNIGTGTKKRYLNDIGYQKKMSFETSSDAIFELDVFIHLIEKKKYYEAKDPTTATALFEQYMSSKDIVANRFYKAYRNLEELSRRERLDITSIAQPNAEERQAIVACQITGADELFVRSSMAVHGDIRGERRKLGRGTTISPAHSSLVIGSAFDYRGLRETGHFEKRYIAGGTAVTMDQLLRHADQRITTKDIELIVDQDGEVLQKQSLYFDGDLLFGEAYVDPSATMQTREFIIRAMMTGKAINEQGQEFDFWAGTPNAEYAQEQFDGAMDYKHRSKATLRVQERYEKLISRVIRDSVELVPLEVIDPNIIDTVIPKVYKYSLVRPSRQRDIPELLRRSPDAIRVTGRGEDHQWAGISYHKGVARVTVPEELRYTIRREDFEELEHYQEHIKVRFGSSRNVYKLDKFFEMIEEQRNSPKRVKRMERQAAAAAQAREERNLDTYAKAQERARMNTRPPLELSQIPPVVTDQRRKSATSHRHRQQRGGQRDARDTII